MAENDDDVDNDDDAHHLDQNYHTGAFPTDLPSSCLDGIVATNTISYLPVTYPILTAS